MEYVLSVFWTIIDLLTSLLCAASFSACRWNRKRTMLIFLAALSLIVMIYYLIPGEFYRILVSLVMVAMILSVFRGSWQKRLLSAFLSMVLIGMFDTGAVYGISALLRIPFDEFVWKKMLYTIVVTATKLVEVLLAYLFCQYWRRRSSVPIRTSWLLLTLLFPAVSVTMLLIIHVGFQDRSDLSVGALIFTLAVAAANVAILYLIHVMEKRTREEQQLHLMNQQMEIQTGSILALEKSYRAQRAATHEFQNQLQMKTSG